jgi:hypothetical protein
MEVNINIKGSGDIKELANTLTWVSRQLLWSVDRKMYRGDQKVVLVVGDLELTVTPKKPTIVHVEDYKYSPDTELIEIASMPNRMCNALISAGAKTIQDVYDLGDKIYRLRNVGSKTVKDINRLLEQAGLPIIPKPSEPAPQVVITPNPNDKVDEQDVDDTEDNNEE